MLLVPKYGHYFMEIVYNIANFPANPVNRFEFLIKVASTDVDISTLGELVLMNIALVNLRFSFDPPDFLIY